MIIRCPLKKRTRTEGNLSGSKIAAVPDPGQVSRDTACAKPYTNTEPDNGKLRRIGNSQRRDNLGVTSGRRCGAAGEHERKWFPSSGICLFIEVQQRKILELPMCEDPT